MDKPLYYVHWVFKHAPQQHIELPEPTTNAYQLYLDAYAFMLLHPHLEAIYKVKAEKPEQPYKIAEQLPRILGRINLSGQ